MLSVSDKNWPLVIFWSGRVFFWDAGSLTKIRENAKYPDGKWDLIAYLFTPQCK